MTLLHFAKVSVQIVCLLLAVTSLVVLGRGITFEAPLEYGDHIVYKFNRSAYEDCIYSQTDDKITCMVKEKFKTVTEDWKFRSSNIEYISVNCMQQKYYSSRQHVCVCVNGSDAANPSKYKQLDDIHYCHFTTVTEGMFSKLGRLRVLDISNNRIQTIEENSFTGLQSLEYLDISNNPVTTFSSGFVCDMPSLRFLKMVNTSLDSKTFHNRPFDCQTNLKELSYIDLSHNRLEFIPNQINQKLPHLKTLILRHNMIEYISQTAFDGAENLRYLDLSHNHVPSLPTMFCSHLTGIKHVNLSSNHIAAFNMATVSQCQTVEVLDISLNMIHSIDGNIQHENNLKILNVSGNGLKVIGDNFLQIAQNLQILDLSLNDLQHLPQSSLMKMDALQVLNLNGNNFNNTSDFSQVFNQTENLKVLNVSSNHLVNIANGTFSSLSMLETLDLSHNSIKTIHNDSFDGLSSLTNLELHHNKLRSIGRVAFLPLVRLNTLDLSHNEMDNGIDTLSIPKQLSSVSLNFNKLSLFPTCFNNTEVRHLKLTSNVITTMRRKSENILNSLEVLELSYNGLESFDNVSFANMPSLNDLDLSFNMLYGPLYGNAFRGTENLTSLNLKKNYINNVDDFFADPWTIPLTVLDLSFNSIGDIESLILKSYLFGVKHQSEYKLREINFEHSYIHSVAPGAFEGFLYLRQVNLKDNEIRTLQPFITEYKTEFLLQNNPLVCDCNMAWLSDSYVVVNNKSISTFDYEIDTCVVKPDNASLPVRKIPPSHFRCRVTSDCDNTCSCFTSSNESTIDYITCHGLIGALPSELSRTAKIIYLDGNRVPFLTLPKHYDPDFITTELYLNRSQIGIIEDIFFSGFGELVFLDLSGNRLRSLSDVVFSNLKRLKTLDLSDNNLEVISPHWFEGLPLVELRLDGNKITNIERPVLSALAQLKTIRYVQLHNNPYECSCLNRQFRTWLRDEGKIVKNRYTIDCFDTGTPILAKPVAEFSCPSTVKGNRNGIIVAIIISSVCLVTVFAFCLYYRRDLLAVLYVKLGVGCLRHTYETNKPYDAFLVYDTNDSKCSEWVDITLRAFLEKREHPYKITTTDRSKLLSNAADIENTQLLDSKCCLFVLNNTVMSKSWCIENFHKAWTLAVKKDSKFKIILIVYGDVELNLLEREMRIMLSQGQYITARSHSVWNRLIYELPNPEKGGKTIRCDDDVSENDVIIYSATGNNVDEYGSVSIH